MLMGKMGRNHDITLTPRDFNYDNHHYQYLKYTKRGKVSHIRFSRCIPAANGTENITRCPHLHRNGVREWKYISPLATLYIFLRTTRITRCIVHIACLRKKPKPFLLAPSAKRIYIYELVKVNIIKRANDSMVFNTFYSVHLLQNNRYFIFSISSLSLFYY